MDTSSDPLLPSNRGPVPRDKFYMVYGIFYLLGLGALIPWNFFITASDYFKYKLRNTTLPESEYLNPQHETRLQATFEGYLTVASTLPNLLFNFITALLIQRISVKKRMVGSLLLIIVMFLLTVIMVKVNTDSWQKGFFQLTLVTAMLLNSGSSILSTSLFGLASLFPARYIQAAMTGQAMGGIFAAVANLISLSIGSHILGSGLGFFIAATVTSVLTLMAYACLYCIRFSKYHMLEVGENLNVVVPPEDDYQVINRNTGCRFYSCILKKIWREGLSVCLVFFVSLSCFPALASSVISVDKDASQWTNKYFAAIVCFLLFNCGDWSGRCIAGSVQWPRFGHSNKLLVLTVFRVVFIPLLMYCNVQPRHLPVYFHSDIYPIIFILLLGLTNGYLSTLAMMYGPKRVVIDESESTGAIMSTFLTTGLVSGSLCGLLLIRSI